MKISTREFFLAWLTVVALLLSISYWFAQPRVKEWAELGKQKHLAEGRGALASRLLEQKTDLDERLEKLRKRVPEYAMDKDVTSDYLKIIEQLAKDAGLSLIQRRPDREKPSKQGRLYELAMDCTWESDLASLLRFLTALGEMEHVVMDMRDLTVTPIPGKKGRLKGNFALVCMYTKSDEVPKSPQPDHADPSDRLLPPSPARATDKPAPGQGGPVPNAMPQTRAETSNQHAVVSSEK